jgi:calcium-dependent protein kinase
VGDLATFLLEKIKRPLHENEVRRLFRDMIISIRYLHQQNILHCDIKLENFVLDCEPSVMESFSTSLHSKHSLLRQIMIPNELVIKVTDFGLSKYLDEYDVPVLSGSIPYIAPEVFNRQKYSEKCDNWSLGVIAYMMLTGDQPFKGRTVKEVETSIKTETIRYPPSLSTHAVDFLRRFFDLDCDTRITLDEALEHPFFTSAAEHQPSASSTPRGANSSPRVVESTSNQVTSANQMHDIAQSLKSYWSMCKFNKVMCKVVAFSLKPNQISDLRNIFNNIDKDRNGSVSMAELQTVLRDNCSEFADEIEQSEEFQLLSRENKDISYSDFLAAALIKRVCIEESQLLMAFALLDQENAGYLSFEAVRNAIGNYMTEDEVKEMINALDKDGDGRIDYQEFILHWRKITIQRTVPQTNGKRLFRKFFTLIRAVNSFRTKKIANDGEVDETTKAAASSSSSSSSSATIRAADQNYSRSRSLLLTSSFGSSSASKEIYTNAEHEIRSYFYRLNTMSCELEDEFGNSHRSSSCKRKVSAITPSSSSSSSMLSSNSSPFTLAKIERRAKRVSFVMPENSIIDSS